MLDWIAEHWDEIGLAVFALVIISSLIIRLTPSKKDDAAFNRFIGFFSIVALRVGWKFPFTPIQIPVDDSKPEGEGRPGPS